MAALSFPLACWLGLEDADTGIEITHLSYARQPATLVYCGDGVTIANLAAAQFPAAGEDWGSVEAVEVWDAPIGGTLLVALFTVEVVAVPQYAIARIPPAGVQIVQVPALRGFGTGRFGTGGFASGTGLWPAGSAVPNAFGVGPYGVGPYGAHPQLAVVEVAFDTSVQVCAPGTWAPGFARAA
jgi:hypothetical protein